MTTSFGALIWVRIFIITHTRDNGRKRPKLIIKYAGFVIPEFRCRIQAQVIMTAIPIDPKCYGDLVLETQILFTFLHVFFGVFSSAGNFTVILAIYKTPSLRTVSNYFLASVALADFFAGFVVHPMFAVRCYENYWYSELPFAKAADIMVLQSFTATSFGLCAISIDR